MSLFTAEELDWMAFKCSFQPKCFYDTMKLQLKMLMLFTQSRRCALHHSGMGLSIGDHNLKKQLHFYFLDTIQTKRQRSPPQGRKTRQHGKERPCGWGVSLLVVL